MPLEIDGKEVSTNAEMCLLGLRGSKRRRLEREKALVQKSIQKPKMKQKKKKRKKKR